MRTSLQILIYSLVLCCSISLHSQAQVATSTKLSKLAINTKIALKESFEIPKGAKSVVLDNGKGKICSCQFFTHSAEKKSQLYETERLFSFKTVTIKGLFDGSQMHVARIYFNNTSDYFKLKCYTRDILVEHISEYLKVGTIDTVANEN